MKHHINIEMGRKWECPPDLWESLPTFSIAGLHIDCGPAVQPASSHQDLPCGLDLEL